MSLFLLISTALSVIYSVDFGSDNVKLGIALPGGIEIALNQQSKRYTPSYFAIYNLSNKAKTEIPEHWEENQTRQLEWLFSYAAEAHGKRFPQNVVKGMPDLLKNTKGLTGRELYSLMLKYLISTAKDGIFKFEASTLMIAVEPWMSRMERYAIYEAIDMGHAKIAGIIDSPVAAATTYGLERQSFYFNSSKVVAFLDLGQSHTWVSIFNFSSNGTQLSCKQLSVSSNETLGGSLVDKALSEYLISKFAEQYKLDPSTFSLRVKNRFLDEAKRAKERLTVSPETSINLEDVLDDYSFSCGITRDEFNSLITDTTVSVNNLLDEALHKAGITKNELESIELLGGTTRVPLFNETIRQWSGMEKLNRTMNSDEAIALGAGYAGAARSAAFIIQKINMSSFCGVNVSFSTNTTDYPLYTEDMPLDLHVYHNISVKALPMNITVQIENEGDFMTYEIYPPENITEEDENVVLEFGFNDLTIPVLWSADYNNTRLHAELYYPDWTLTREQYINSTNFLEFMDNVVYKRNDKLKLKNQHEELTYKLRDRLEYDEEFLSVLTEEEKANISIGIEKHLEWANNETAKKSRKILREQLDDLDELTRDADTRLSERKNRPIAINKLNNTINETRFALEDLPTSKPWITEENFTTLRNALNKTETWFAEKLQLIEQENATSNPLVRAREFDVERWSLSDSLDRIKDIPKPKPIINSTILNGTSVDGTFINATDFNGTGFNITDSNFTFFNSTEFNETTSESINSTIETNETETINTTLETNETEILNNETLTEDVNQTSLENNTTSTPVNNTSENQETENTVNSEL